MIRKPLLWIFIIILIMAGALAWRIFLLRASVIIQAPAPFTVTFTPDKGRQSLTFTCASSPCSQNVVPQIYQIEVTSDGYEPQVQQIEILPRRENPLIFELQKIPTLTLLTEQPRELIDTIAQRAEQASQFFFDEENRLFQRTTPQNIFLAELNADSSEQLQIFPNDKNTLYILSPQSIYEVNVEQKRKFRILSATEDQRFTTINVLKNNILAIDIQNAGEQNTLLLLADGSTKPFLESTSASLICADPRDPTDFIAATASSTSPTFYSVSMSADGDEGADNSLLTTPLASFSFTDPIEEIFCETENTVLIQTQNQWFSLML